MLRRIKNFQLFSDATTVTDIKVRLLGKTHLLKNVCLSKSDYHTVWSLSVINDRPYPKQPYLIVLTINNKLPYLSISIYEYQKLDNPDRYEYTNIDEIFLQEEQVFEALPRFYHTNESTMIKRLINTHFFDLVEA